MADNSRFHPALAVNNVKNVIPIILEIEKGQYSSWVELFKIHYRVYQVMDHIIPTPPVSSDKGKETTTVREDELWSRLDAIVLQWIYGTISNNLLHTILEPDSTAQQAWECLERIFQDNKHSRAVYLENQFTQVHKDDFPNVSAYCQELKMLADQLSDVGAPVNNHRLVLQLIAGVNENYDSVTTFIQQSDPLPPFYEDRSKLILEETRKAKQVGMASGASGTALVTTNIDNEETHGSGRGTSHGNGQNRNNTGGRGKNNNSQNNRTNNRRKNNSGCGRGKGGQNHSFGGGNHQQAPHSCPWQHPPPWWQYNAGWAPPGWATPPCPYPSSS